MRSRSALQALAVALALGGCSNSTPPPISVSVSPSFQQTIDPNVTVTFNARVANDTKAQGVTWSLTGTGTLSSTTGLSTTYQPPSSGITVATQVKVTATSVADPTKRVSTTITINPYPAMPFQKLASGTVGVPYSQSIILTGGTAPFQWNVYDGPIDTGWRVGGEVPNGLALDSTNGTISGTPTAAGTWYFETIASDSYNAYGFAPLSIQINPASPPQANPVPFLNQSLAPTAVVPGGPTFVLNVNGTGFVPGATVDWNTTPLSTTYVDSEHLNALVPAATTATAQTASVTVVNPAPGGGTSNPIYFEVGAPVTSVAFANAPGSPLQVKEVWQLAVADFNRDGKPDLAATASIYLDVMLGNGDGTFTATPSSPVPIPSPPYDDFGSPYTWALVPGDFDKSGHTGLAVSLSADQAAAVLFGNNDGSFRYATSLANTSGMYAGALLAADFNGDGNLDLFATSNINGTSPTVLEGYSDGAFNSVPQDALLRQIYPLGGFWGLTAAVGDFTGQGKLDVAVAASEPSSTAGIVILQGNGDNTFLVATGSPIALGQSLGAIAAADFNSDGKLDLAVTDFSKNEVFILLGNGDGTFQAPISIPVGTSPVAVAVGDFTNDGKLDLAIANSGDNTITLLLGNGDGTFTEASSSPYAVGNLPESIVAADFNGDGKLDLAVANWNDYSVSILLQK